MYTDNTLLTSGKFQFVRLCRVPASYLLRIYEGNSQQDKELYEYVAANLERLKALKVGPEAVKMPTLRCNKQSFFSEKVAKEELHRIMNQEQAHKKPVRTYECARCGAWHLTSIPFEKWDKDLKPAGVIQQIQRSTSGSNRRENSIHEFAKGYAEKSRALRSGPGKVQEMKKRCKKFTYGSEKEARYAVHKREEKGSGI